MDFFFTPLLELWKGRERYWSAISPIKPSETPSDRTHTENTSLTARREREGLFLFLMQASSFQNLERCDSLVVLFLDLKPQWTGPEIIHNEEIRPKKNNLLEKKH